MVLMLSFTSKRMMKHVIYPMAPIGSLPAAMPAKPKEVGLSLGRTGLVAQQAGVTVTAGLAEGAAKTIILEAEGLMEVALVFMLEFKFK